MNQGRGMSDEGRKSSRSLVPRPSSLVRPLSYIEENLLNMKDVFQIEQPAQHHLDRQRHHDQEKVRADVIPRRAHLQIEAAERSNGHYGRQAEVCADESESEDLADDPELRQ